MNFSHHKILIHDWCGHPFTFDLARELSRDNLVHYVYTLASAGPKAKVGDDTNYLKTHRIDVPRIQKQQFFVRWFQDLDYGRRVAQVIKHVCPDLVISANTPLGSQSGLVKACERLSCPFIFWQQDIISIAARAILPKKVPLLGRPVSAYFAWLEKTLLQRSQRIIVIAQEFRDIITEWGVEGEKIDVIPNWAPIADIPVLPKHNDFARRHGLTEKFVALYSGTMGMKHNPYFILQLARHFEKDKEIHFVVATDGVGWEILNREISRQQRNNILLLPLQPFEIFPQVLATADILLVMLEQDAGIFSVPSKVWSGYCAQRPTLLAAPEENLSSKITQNVRAGIVVPPNNLDAAIAAIRKMQLNPKLRQEMGRNARHYAENHFPIDRVAGRFKEAFARVVS